jgi:hypothetical protein
VVDGCHAACVIVIIIVILTITVLILRPVSHPIGGFKEELEVLPLSSIRQSLQKVTQDACHLNRTGKRRQIEHTRAEVKDDIKPFNRKILSEMEESAYYPFFSLSSPSSSFFSVHLSTFQPFQCHLIPKFFKHFRKSYQQFFCIDERKYQLRRKAKIKHKLFHIKLQRQHIFHFTTLILRFLVHLLFWNAKSTCLFEYTTVRSNVTRKE